jgi:hypothetical protein
MSAQPAVVNDYKSVGTPEQLAEFIRDTSAKTVDPGLAARRQEWLMRQSEQQPNVGVKYDQNKPRMDLLDWDALGGLAAVLTFGANKYAAHNWRNGISYSRITAAMLRHLAAIQQGEDVDPESGLPHIDHLGCCWMFLSNFMKNRPDLDDRYKHVNTN